MIRKIASGLRIDSGASAREYELTPSSGGSRWKRVQYVIRILQTNSATDQLTLEIQHGPDGALWETHSAYPSLANVNKMLIFDSDEEVILGEHFRAIVKTAASAGQSFLVDVYEITKPF